MDAKELTLKLAGMPCPQYRYSYTLKNYAAVGEPAAWKPMPTGVMRANGVQLQISALEYCRRIEEAKRD